MEIFCSFLWKADVCALFWGILRERDARVCTGIERLSFDIYRLPLGDNDKFLL